MRQVAGTVAVDAALRREFARLRTEFARIQQRAPSAARSERFYALADRFDWTVIGATPNEHLRRTVAELRPHTARLRTIFRTALAGQADALDLLA